ncbi:dTDP-4-dehydrorhamnose reductase [Luteibacter rhizovicinus]|uniref:dTDP-4-dehydrorhamnose reductase n=2 Tax=Luteibacter rhizovicinus TaxID=242606 RepID=A0A4R3YTK5_9GAMM|nr:dTDP-4-dehydrorhamnose reductase [Luteibacter rhizovicinus]
MLRRERPDLVVNASAYTAVDQAETDISTAMAINAEVPRAIGHAVTAWNGAVVHYSTDYVFDGMQTRPYTEEDATAPLGIYGQSKLRGELALSASGADHLILRTAWVYSLRGRNFLTTMLRLATERPQVRIVADQRGTPTSAGFLADATVRIASSWMGDPIRRTLRGGVYHLTANGETTWYDFAEALFSDAHETDRIANVPTILPIATSDYPTPARRPAYSVLAIDRIVKTFAVAAPHWRDDLRHVLGSAASR